MKTYIFRRLIALIPTLLIVATIGFLLIHLTPGDPAVVMLGEEATEEQVDMLRQQLGLDLPVPIQFGRWLGRLVQGDLGQSIFLKRPVTTAIFERLECTLLLTMYGLGIAIVLGIVMGILAAVKHNTVVDQSLMMVALLGVSMPSFWLGLNLILLFALRWRMFPAASYTPVAQGWNLALRSLTLPAFTLGFVSAAPIARMVRSSMLQVLNQDYIRTARSKGLRERTVIVSHAFRNALIPTVTIIGMTVGGLIGGAMVIEQVFALPGVGRLVLSSIARRDYPVIQGILIFFSSIYVFVNLIVDIIYVYIDPRVKYM